LEISDSYESHLRPGGVNKKPLYIVAELNLRQIVNVDEKMQQISLETTLRLNWRDDNISIAKEAKDYDGLMEDVKTGRPYILLDPSFVDCIWIPDIFVDQSINLRVPTFHSKPRSVRVYNDSMIRYSSRFNFDVACPMDFSNYPVDNQTCLVKFESYSHNHNHLNMTWDSNETVHSTPHRKNLLTHFEFDVKRETYVTKCYAEPFTGILFRLHLKRRIFSYLCDTYMPSSFIVFLGYLVFFLPKHAVSARTVLGMTAFLTLITMNVYVRSRLPEVSYLTYMDFWVMGCMLLVFVINICSIVEMRMFEAGKKVDDSEKVNQVFLFVFPFVFIFLNAVYWLVIYS